MNISRQLRRWHTWIGLVIGVQVLLWMISGLYMVAVDIDFIHGDTLVRNERPTLVGIDRTIPIGVLLDRYQGLYSAKLKALPGMEHPIYELGTPDGLLTIDAVSGAVLSPLAQSTVENLARQYYTGSAPILKVELIETVPVEIRGQPPYLWRVDFDDWLQTSFYLYSDTGALVTRRHRLWRIFDTFWMLHVMDYGYERDDVNNGLLRVAAAVGLVFAITGLWLLVYSFGRTQRAQRTST